MHANSFVKSMFIRATPRRVRHSEQNAATLLLPIILAAAFASSPASIARAQALDSHRVPTSESTVDASITPGDDFFAYANGSWLKATAIPAGKDRWGARHEIDGIASARVAQLLRDASGAARGTLARKVADFHAALLNVAAIEAKGLGPLRPYLDSIEAAHDKTAITLLIARAMRADVDPLNWGIYRSASLLGLAVEPSIHGETTNVAFLLQGGLGLPDRENYLSAEPRMLALRSRYRSYVARVLTRAGFDHADSRADAVMALESAIAQSQATGAASANDHHADTVWTRAEFTRQAPGMDWPVFFAEAGLQKEATIVPWQIGAVKGVAALVASQSLETWKDYLRVRAFDAYAVALPGAFARVEAQPMTRAQHAAHLTQMAMNEAIGRMYAERYFSARDKARVQAIVANVVAAFARRVEKATWMSPDTRALALEKVKRLYIGVGYPEQWPDYSDLVVDPTDALGNMRRVEDRNRHHALAQLGAAVDMRHWWLSPQAASAVLVFQQNAYFFAAALLQPPKYDPSASDAANYGAIGAIIGHDVVHYIDVLGAEYELDGRMRHWWTPADVQHYQALTEPLAKQFAGYRPFPDVAINGTLTLRENVADLAGLSAAFDAYRATIADKATDREYVRKSDREFFIAFGQSFRSKLSDEAMRTQAATNDHAPDVYRIATVRNLDAWYDAFDVRPGQRLYLEPSARVRIW